MGVLSAERSAAAGAAVRTRLLGVSGRGWLLRAASLVIVLGVWEWYGRHTNPILFTYPTAIVAAGVKLLQTGVLEQAMAQSLSLFAIGLALAVVTGIAVGLAIGRSRIVEALTDLPLNALYAVPTVALVPILVRWVGFGAEAKVVVVLLFAFFPIAINTARGVRETDPELIEVARSYLAREIDLWRDVVLPSALPYVLAGIRLAVGRALVGIVIAEFYTAISGLGNLIVTYANDFQTAKAFVPVVVLMILGVLLSAALQFLELRLAPWRSA